jgi:hypothetical protein
LIISVALAHALVSFTPSAAAMIVRHVACDSGGVVTYTTNKTLGDAKGYDLWMATNDTPPFHWKKAGEVDSMYRSVEVGNDGNPVSYAQKYKCVRHRA